MSPSRVIVGLDYGTTSTGVSVAVIEDVEKSGNLTHWTFRDWPPNKRSPKVPSKIAYRADNSSFSMRNASFWGFEILPSMKCYFWTKLQLDHHAEQRELDDEFLRALSGLHSVHPAYQSAAHKEAKHVVADYLEHLLKYTRDYENGELFQHHPVELRVTVPATWSREAMKMTKEAVETAWTFKKPQDRLILDSEPEAAAEAVYQACNDKFKTGDGILICDCGGGTVDVTTYIVKASSGFNLARLASMDGAKCGGAAIDSRLFHFMEKHLRGAFQYLGHLLTTGSEFMEAFEKVKMEFDEYLKSPETPVLLRLPLRRGLAECDLRFYDQSTSSLVLTTEIIQSFFDPVILKIKSLVVSQMAAAEREYGSPIISKIVLVGGLGSSRYLQTALRQSFDIPHRLSVIVPNSKGITPISAVSMGAMLRGIRGCAERPMNLEIVGYYGIGFPQALKPIMHRGTAKRIDWIIQLQADHLNEYVVQGHNGTQSCERSGIYSSEDCRVMTVPIYYCRNPESPVGTIDDKDVILVDFIPVDFSYARLDLREFNYWTSGSPNPLTYYELKFSVEWWFDAQNRELHFMTRALGVDVGRRSLPLWHY